MGHCFGFRDPWFMLGVSGKIQTGSLNEYIELFENDTIIRLYVPEEERTKIFIRGLKEEVAAIVRELKPSTLTEAITIARLQENNASFAGLFRSLADLKKKLQNSIQANNEADNVIHRQRCIISDLGAMLSEEKKLRKIALGKAKDELNSAILRAQFEAQEEIKHQAEVYLRQELSKDEEIAKLMNENDKLRSTVEDLKRKSLVMEIDAVALLKEKDKIISQLMTKGEELSKNQAVQEATIKMLRAQIREHEDKKMRFNSKLQVDKVENARERLVLCEKITNGGVSSSTKNGDEDSPEVIEVNPGYDSQEPLVFDEPPSDKIQTNTTNERIEKMNQGFSRKGAVTNSEGQAYVQPCYIIRNSGVCNIMFKINGEFYVLATDQGNIDHFKLVLEKLYEANKFKIIEGTTMVQQPELLHKLYEGDPTLMIRLQGFKDDFPNIIDEPKQIYSFRQCYDPSILITSLRGFTFAVGLQTWILSYFSASMSTPSDFMFACLQEYKIDLKEIYQVLERIIVIIWNCYYKEYLKEKEMTHPGKWIVEWRIAWILIWSLAKGFWKLASVYDNNMVQGNFSAKRFIARIWRILNFDLCRLQNES